MKNYPPKKQWKQGFIVFTLFLFGLISLHVFYTREMRTFTKTEIDGTISRIDKYYSTKGGGPYYSVTVKMRDGTDFNIGEGMPEKMLSVISVGDTIHKNANESIVFIVNKNRHIELINRGPWEKNNN